MQDGNSSGDFGQLDRTTVTIGAFFAMFTATALATGSGLVAGVAAIFLVLAMIHEVLTKAASTPDYMAEIRQDARRITAQYANMGWPSPFLSGAPVRVNGAPRPEFNPYHPAYISY